MKRFALTFAAAGAVALLAAGPISAQENRGLGGEGAFAARRMGRCLATLNLSATQKADIDAAIAAAKPTLQTDRQALRADRQKLRTDALALRDQIVSKLDVDQKNQLKGRFRGPRGAQCSNSNTAS